MRGLRRDKELLLHLFQHADCLFSGYRWKPREEIGQRIAGLKVVEKGLHRHTGPSKHGRATHDLLIDADVLPLHQSNDMAAVEIEQGGDEPCVGEGVWMRERV